VWEIQVITRVLDVEVLLEVLVLKEDIVVEVELEVEVEVVVGGSSRGVMLLCEEGRGWAIERLELVDVN
jgi:hypothetical protein